MRILFAGSPAIAVPTFELLARTREVVGVLTNPDSPRGRGKRVEPTDIAAAAGRINLERLDRGLPRIPVFKPDRLGPEARDLVSPLGADLLVVVAYGRIFGPKFLALFPQGGINLHPSLLPRYRGCAPIPAAILNRDRETGLSVQRLALEMDAGDLLAVETLSLDGTETTESLSTLAAERGARLVSSVLDSLEAGNVRPVPQDHGAATYCRMLAKEDGRLDWTASAEVLDARIRAFHPWPGAFTTHGELVLNVLEARPYQASSGSPRSTSAAGTVVGVDKAAGILVQTGDGLLALKRLQYETKKPLDWRSFLNGARDFIGARLGVVPPSE